MRTSDFWNRFNNDCAANSARVVIYISSEKVWVKKELSDLYNLFLDFDKGFSFTDLKI